MYKRQVNGHFRAELNWEWHANTPSWVALRVQSGHATIPANAPLRPRAKGVNVFGQGLFAHTSPIYVDFAGKRVFHKETAQKLVKEMESLMKAMEMFGKAGISVLEIWCLSIVMETIYPELI